MDFNINIRQTQLENFQQFIDDSKQNLQKILDEIGWSSEDIQKQNPLVKCIYNKAHLVASKNLEAHHKICSIKSLGYQIDEVELSEAPSSSKSAITIENEEKAELFKRARKSHKSFTPSWNGTDPDPKTSDRLISTFSPDERLILYEYAVAITEGPPVPPEFNICQPIDENKELTYEERLELNRNLKRRRIKYKSVHTNHKNHTEVIREVINNQMELYTECLHEMKEKASESQVPKEKKDSLEIETKQEEEEDGESFYDETKSIASRRSDYSARSYKSSRSHHRSRDNSYERRSRSYYKEQHRKERFIEQSKERSNFKERPRHSEHSDYRTRKNEKTYEAHRNYNRSPNRSRSRDHDNNGFVKYSNKEKYYDRTRGSGRGRGRYKQKDYGKEKYKDTDHRSRKSQHDYYHNEKHSRRS